MSEHLLFAYGSLVSPASAAATLGREVEASQPVRLRGWRRRWSTFRDNLTSEKTFALADGGARPRHCLGLNIEPDDGADGPNGVLLSVTEAELERLDVREMRYERVEVGAGIDTRLSGGQPVVAYAARARHHAPTPPPDAVIIAGYQRTVEAAFAELGPEQLDLYLTTTEAPPVEPVEAVLVRDRIPEGNPREW